MTAASGYGRPDYPRSLLILGWLVLALFALLLIRYQIHLLSYMDWEDESETVVGAKLMVEGWKLYGDFFNHHGPLTFLTGWVLEHLGDFGIVGHRVPILLLQWAALLSLAFTPLIRDRLITIIFACIVGALMVLYLPDLLGHMYKYQTIAGLLLLIAMAQFVLPSILRPEQRLHPARILVGSAILASLPFFAITYVPVTLLLLAAAFRRSQWRLALLGVGAGVALNLLFLLATGSVRGYLAYHFYLNTRVLPLYDGPQGLWDMFLHVYRSVTDGLMHLLIMLVVVLGLTRLAASEHGFPWRALLVGVALASLLVRGGAHEFHRLTYLYACMPIPLLLFNYVARPSLAWLPLAALGLTLLLKLSLLLPQDRDRLDARPLPETSEFSELVRLMSEPGDPIIAFAFRNLEYIHSGRLPASGNYFYFPWQEKYNESPVLGVKIDTCAEIDAARPKLMMIDRIDVLERYPWDSYGGCVQDIMDAHYTRIAHRPFYVRNDIDLGSFGVAAEGSYRHERPGPRLGRDDPAPLLMSPQHLAEPMELSRLGIRFVLPDHAVEGRALLRLEGPDDAHVSIPFDLEEIRRYRYFYFDPPAGAYIGGVIEGDRSSEVRLLESGDDGDASTTCLVYEYSDGTRRFTPDCPFI
jgi:hypothetical protein